MFIGSWAHNVESGISLSRCVIHFYHSIFRHCAIMDKHTAVRVFLLLLDLGVGVLGL